MPTPNRITYSSLNRDRGEGTYRNLSYFKRHHHDAFAYLRTSGVFNTRMTQDYVFTIISLQRSNCGECNQLKSGIEFGLHKGKGTSFLCWKHFRKMLKALNQAKMLKPQSLPFTEVSEGGTESWSDSETEGKITGKSTTEGWSDSETEGESHGKSTIEGESK